VEVTSTSRVRFDPEQDRSDVGTATAFLLLPALLVLVAGVIFVSSGWIFQEGFSLPFASRQFSGNVTVDARKHAGASRESGTRVLLNPGDYLVRVKDGGYSPWGEGARPADGWFWLVQIDVGPRHYELGDNRGAPDRAGATAGHLGQSVAIKVDQPTEAYFWIADQFPDDNEGSVVVQVEPAPKK